jgi:hypothetical protein
LNNNDPAFCTLFLQPIFLALFFKFHTLKNIRSTWYFSIVGADWLGDWESQSEGSSRQLLYRLWDPRFCTS